MIVISGSRARLCQYLVAFCANLSGLNYCFAIGWISSTVVLLTSDNTPMSAGPLSTAQVSLFGSMLYLGAIAGSLIFGSLADCIGRKWSLYIGTLMHIAAYILIALSENFVTLVIARVLNGIGVGCSFVVIPVFVSEISEKEIRGILGGIFNGVLHCGTLLTRIICAYVGFHITPYIFIACNSVFLCVFLIMHETPQYLLLKGRERAAEEALRFFRAVPEGKEMPQKCKEEFEELKNSPTLKNQTESLSWDDFKPKSSWKALIVCTVLYAGKFLSGIQVIVAYLGVIFTRMNFTMNPELAALIATLLGVPSAFVLFSVVESWGRKVVMIVSALLTAAFLVPLALFARYNAIWHVHDYWALAVIGVVLFVSTPGVVSMPLQLSAEILPPKLRSCIASAMMMMAWLGMFTIVHFFLIWIEDIGLDILMWFFIGWCIFEALFVLKFLPETKGKTYDEISKDF